MSKNTNRPRRTELNPIAKCFYWMEGKGINLARLDLESLSFDQKPKVSSFKQNPELAKNHNHVFWFKNRIETDYKELEKFTQNLIIAKP